MPSGRRAPQQRHAEAQHRIAVALAVGRSHNAMPLREAVTSAAPFASILHRRARRLLLPRRRSRHCPQAHHHHLAPRLRRHHRHGRRHPLHLLRHHRHPHRYHPPTGRSQTPVSSQRDRSSPSCACTRMRIAPTGKSPSQSMEAGGPPRCKTVRRADARCAPAITARTHRTRAPTPSTATRAQSGSRAATAVVRGRAGSR